MIADKQLNTIINIFVLLHFCLICGMNQPLNYFLNKIDIQTIESKNCGCADDCSCRKETNGSCECSNTFYVGASLSSSCNCSHTHPESIVPVINDPFLQCEIHSKLSSSFPRTKYYHTRQQAIPEKPAHVIYHPPEIDFS